MEFWFGVVFYLSVTTNLYTDLNTLENICVMFDMGIAAFVRDLFYGCVFFWLLI